jgi:molecular chaperone GrpE
MNQHKHDHPPHGDKPILPQPPPPPASSKPPEAAAPAGAAPYTAAPPSAEEQVATLQGELDDLQSRLLRVSADYQNYARRSQQNLAEARRQQLIEVARALLNVCDHFDRALEVDPKKVTAESLLQGVQIVRDEFTKLLEQFGIQRITAQPGEAFDAARHEAMMRQKTQDVPAGHVAAQLQPGYTLGDLTLRPAKVSVAE